MEIVLSKVLQREFKGQGLKLKDVSNETGIPISSLADWREGRIPSAKSLPRLQLLADFLRLTLSELIFDRQDRKWEGDILQRTIFSDQDKTYRISIERLN